MPVIGTIDTAVSDPNNIVRLLTAITTPLQSLESAFQALTSQRFVDTAVGAQLDLVGKIVGEARVGLSDDDYRRYIRARIVANRASGRTEELIKVVSLVINDVTVQVIVTNEPPAALTLRVGAVLVSDALANILVDFMGLAAAAGVRVLVATQYVDDDATLMTAQATFAPGALSSGATSLTVSDTTGFAAAGTLDIDFGTPVQETVTYTGTTPTTFTGVSALAHNHGAGACVQVHDAVDDQGLAVVAVVPGSLSTGATSITVDTTAGFASSGTLYLDYETAGVQETLAYSGITSTSFTGVTALAHDHTAGALIRPTTGLLGGRFASARDADYTSPEIDT